MQDPSFQLATELRIVITRLIKKLRVSSDSGATLSLTERSTLSLLDLHKTMTPGKLASMEKITTQSMSQILAHLLSLGLINRQSTADDKRKAIISLSKTGQQMLHRIRNERDEWLHQALESTCTAKEKELLQRAIVPLTRLVEFE